MNWIKSFNTTEKSVNKYTYDYFCKMFSNIDEDHQRLLKEIKEFYNIATSNKIKHEYNTKNDLEEIIIFTKKYFYHNHKKKTPSK